MPDNSSNILSLARAGATSRAWDRFVAAGLDQADEIVALTLKGRLLKDRARQTTGAEKTALFAEAGTAYERAAILHPDSYPLINAAAMAMFAGDRIRCELMASKTLDLIETDPGQGETPYWREATRAEALLLLGRTDPARASLAQAIALAPQAWEDHASTLRQFASILGETRLPADWLDPLRPPASIQFSGIMGIDAEDGAAAQAIKLAIANLAPGFGYGALAAGADIIAAEALLEAQAELYVVLPSNIAAFKQSSVVPFGASWVSRFDALIDLASEITICNGFDSTTSAGVALAEYHAMGLAARNASLLESRAVALRMTPAERLAIADPWRLSGRELVHVPVSVSSSNSAAMLDEGSLAFSVATPRQPIATPVTLADAINLIAEAGGALDCTTDGTTCAEALLNAAPKGTILGSSNAAMALNAEGRCTRIEPMGEMATPLGDVEVYAVALQPPPGNMAG
jgi:hypothetical protein